MFPGHGSASQFVIISSLFRKPSNRDPKTPAEVQEDLQYWLRFIVSNSKRGLQQCILPNVTVVLTHFDKISQPSQNLQLTVDSIQRVRDKFHGFVDLYPTVFTVDARSSASVNKLAHHLRKTSTTILQRVPRIYQVKVPALRIRSRHDNKDKVEMKRKAVASCLHHIGEVIYFDQLGFLILDLKLDVKKASSMQNGFISSKQLEKILRQTLQSNIPGMGSKVFENLEANDLVNMMLKLELCYKQDPADPNSLLLIPSILEEGRGKPQVWQISSPNCIYAGRHLECDDSSHMFLTSGFFPLLQHVPVQRLKQALLSVPADGIYDYQHTWDPVSDYGTLILPSNFDLAHDLLSDDELREVLHRRYHDLYNLAVELEVPPESDPDRANEVGNVDPSFAGIAKGIRDLKQEIQGLRYYEHKLLVELDRKVEERKVPNMFFFVRTDNYSRRLITNMITGMNALRLHMLCEFRREMHVVEDQMGCEVMQVDNRAVQSLAPYMNKFMKLVTFALKIGAHLAAGMGEMIPDLSREVSHLATSSTVGVAAMGTRNRNIAAASSRDMQQDLREAQQWVLDFLRDRRCSTGKDIADKFGLWRVRYRDDGQIAWVCRRHMVTRACEIFQVPI
ncbi:Protein TORNADO 1 [Linum grandiflorum]